MKWFDTIKTVISFDGETGKWEKQWEAWKQGLIPVVESCMGHMLGSFTTTQRLCSGNTNINGGWHWVTKS